jgi:hypothetical protein
MDAEIFVPFTFFAFLAAIILVPTIVKERTKTCSMKAIAPAEALAMALSCWRWPAALWAQAS